MDFLGWTALAGGLLLTMALASPWVRRLPISTATIYLAVGIGLGPTGWGLLTFDPVGSAGVIERVTEAALVLSLFIGGLKLRLPLRDPAWRAAVVLAGPVLLVSIAAVAGVARFALGLPWWLALLLGAVLAPTDPVLASSVSVSDARDHDRLRYGLSGEAGLNDGAAFPFVMLALGWLAHGGPGPWLAEWALHRVVWAVPAALLLGFAMGRIMGTAAIALRIRQRDPGAPSDLFALALVTPSYVAAETIGAWGFLTVFAAGVGLRRAELAVVARSPHPDVEPRTADEPVDHPPAEHLVGAAVDEEELRQPAVAAGVLVAETLSFGTTAERILEILLVVAVGVALGDWWDWRGLGLAVLLFVVVRPVASHVLLLGTPTTRAQRWLMGIFGVRGIGSLYYVAYALSHGVPAEEGALLVALTMPVIAASIVIHGVGATPALARYERSLERVG